MKSYLDINTDSYNLVAENYKTEHSTRLEWEAELIKFKNYLPQNPKLIVDLGCGTGEETQWLSENLPTSQIIGIDASSAMVNVATSSYPTLQLQQSNIVEYVSPFEVDGIWARASLHHLTLDELDQLFYNISKYLHGVIGMVNKYGEKEEIEEKNKYGRILRRYFQYFDENLIEELSMNYGFKSIEQYHVQNDHHWLVTFLSIQ